MTHWDRDRLHIRAKREGYRSRAAYKLKEIQQRFRVIRRDDNIVDFGAAPGSWLQVARGYSRGQIVGVDINEIQPIDGVTTIVGDLTEEEIQEEIAVRIPRIDLILSDASPKLSGHRSLDQARAISLCIEVLKFADRYLADDGRIIIKTFQGELFPDLLREIRERFGIVQLYRPSATRKGSSEIYIIGKRFRRAGSGAGGSVRTADHESQDQPDAEMQS